MHTKRPLRVAVVGATGIAGQQFLTALAGHPTMKVTKLAASERSAGKKYKAAITAESGAMSWYPDGPLPADLADVVVENASQLALDDLDLVFSAVESDAAKTLEAMYAAKLPVISTASAYRYESDVPILIPAVNGAHSPLVLAQRKRGWGGFVVPIPNCTTTGLAIALAPLHAAFGIDKVVMTSLQAVSGAGRSPGVIALDNIDNVIPYIAKEEEKVEKETKKLLGKLMGESIAPADIEVTCHCTRVPVLEGHFETVTVSLARGASLAEVVAALEAFGTEISPKTHPSAPERWITLTSDPYRPQPRLDRNADRGMTTTVGRLREDKVLGRHGLKFCLVSHNTKMGAAMGAVLVAEDLLRRGLIAGSPG